MAFKYPWINDKFKTFHEKNPLIFKLFMHKTKQLIDAGHKKYSAWAVFNSIRWDNDISTKRIDNFKIANDYIARYVRLLEVVNPKFKGFYDTKPMKCEKKRDSMGIFY